MLVRCLVKPLADLGIQTQAPKQVPVNLEICSQVEAIAVSNTTVRKMWDTSVDAEPFRNEYFQSFSGYVILSPSVNKIKRRDINVVLNLLKNKSRGTSPEFYFVAVELQSLTIRSLLASAASC